MNPVDLINETSAQTNGSAVAADGQELAGLTELRWLDLTSSKATEKGAAALRKALPKARIVRSPWEKKTYTNAKGSSSPSAGPESHNPKKAYPLVVFLHGSGARGTDNGKQLYDCSHVWVDAKNRKKYPCFVVYPQCSGKMPLFCWDRYVRAGLVMGFIQEVEKRHRIDPRRIYVTGLSDGAWGVWHLLGMYPHRFATAVPVCGLGMTGPGAPRVAGVPVWIFHGEKDKVGPVREMVTALKKAGGKPKYTGVQERGPPYLGPRLQ